MRITAPARPPQRPLLIMDRVPSTPSAWGTGRHDRKRRYAIPSCTPRSPRRGRHHIRHPCDRPSTPAHFRTDSHHRSFWCRSRASPRHPGPGTPYSGPCNRRRSRIPERTAERSALRGRCNLIHWRERSRRPRYNLAKRTGYFCRPSCWDRARTRHPCSSLHLESRSTRSDLCPSCHWWRASRYRRCCSCEPGSQRAPLPKGERGGASPGIDLGGWASWADAMDASRMPPASIGKLSPKSPSVPITVPVFRLKSRQGDHAGGSVGRFRGACRRGHGRCSGVGGRLV
jgi:hypothetical protein